ncbi:hypothetical protein B9Z55_025592 [Caenorhabditis nigoni]|uniref:F-box domain-containing protein n=2 Tax=Caenorhabditis nigoni TaxID=1611254 RepID=A0A2G5SZA4_9PELO|nr:hypothetical protein B9Z55_025592 [Caenorhabditis nigoni]
MPVVSYPSLRCILEHMKADERLFLSARCPKISKMDRGIPLRVDRIRFQENSVAINYIEYEIGKDETLNLPTLILFNYISHASFRKTFSKNYGVEEAARKVVEYLLGGRSNIRVQELSIWPNGYKNMQNMFGLFSNMKVSFFDYWDNGLHEFHPLVESPSPQFRFKAYHPTDLENAHVRTAKKLVITRYGYNEPDIWLETHKNLPNQEVIVDRIVDGLHDNNILELIEHWKETRRAVGSSFSICKGMEDTMEVFLENVKERFKGSLIKSEKAQSIFSKIKSVSIKIDSKSKIVVYGNTHIEWARDSKVLIKVMAVESSERVSFLILEHFYNRRDYISL